MAPRGHITRQKNLSTVAHPISTIDKTIILSANKFPSTDRNSGRVAINGSPASNVPTGQMYSQNVGAPIPAKSVTVAGIIKTKTSSIKNFIRTAPRGSLNLGVGSLKINSCINPNGHK